MNIDVLTDEELISLYKSHNWSLSQMDRDLNLGKEHSRRLFNKRGIDFNALKVKRSQDIIDEYNKNPNYCQYEGCNKVLDWRHRNNKYCCVDCAVNANNLKRNPEKYTKTTQLIKSNDESNVEIKRKVSNCLFCNSIIPYGRKFCNNNCQNKYESDKRYKDFLNNSDKYCRPNYTPKGWIRSHILLEQNNRCIICNGIQEHNGKPLVFVLDHIDGDASNNKRENLRLVCSNCDSQLDTFKSKNKHSTRRNYWKEKILKQINQ